MSTHPATQPDAAHATQGQFQLLKERRFLPFFLVQFLGAGNDNIFKFAFTVLATYSAAEWGGLDSKIAGAVIGGIFILPFVLFSATAGQIADKYDKDRLIRFVKSLEIGIALVIAAGFIWKIPACLFTGVFLMGLHSTLFGPLKYGILPQVLKPEELVGGNGLVEMATFLAILGGTILGTTLIAMPEGGAFWVGVATIALAVAGLAAAWTMPATAPVDPSLRLDWNVFRATWRNVRELTTNRTVFLSCLGISWFWFFGSIYFTQLPVYTSSVLGGSPAVYTALLATFSIGVALGSLLCEKLSGHKVEIGLVPFGAIGLSLFALDLWWASPMAGSMGSGQSIGAVLSHFSTWRVLFDLVMIGMFGGFFIVPLYALIQTRSEPQYRSRVIAGNNILNALFMVVAAGMGAGLLAAGFSIAQLILVTAVLNGVVAIYIFTLVPEFLLRFVVWMLVHTVYRLRVTGAEHIPDSGPVVLIANHVSFVDALIIMAACRRPVRFVMDHKVFRWPLLSFVFRTSGAIPIASATDDAALTERAFDEVAKALAAGEVVGIFPEGKVSASGEMTPFRPGIARIVARTPAPVVPMALGGLWGSYFSRKGGAAMTKPLRRGIFNSIRLNIGAPMAPAAVSPEALQAAVAALLEDPR